MSAAPTRSGVLYLRLARADVALFRFLLEAWEGAALFTSLGADAQGRETLHQLDLAPLVLEGLAPAGVALHMPCTSVQRVAHISAMPSSPWRENRFNYLNLHACRVLAREVL